MDLGKKKKQCTITVIWVIPLKGLGFGSWIWCMWSGKHSPFTPSDSWKKVKQPKTLILCYYLAFHPGVCLAPLKNSLFFIRDCGNEGNDLPQFSRIFRWSCAWASHWLLSLFWKARLIIRSSSVTPRFQAWTIVCLVLLCIMACGWNENDIVPLISIVLGL